MMGIISRFFIEKFFRRQKPKSVAEYLDRFAERLTATGIPGILDRFYEAEESFATIHHDDVATESADGLTLRGRLYPVSEGDRRSGAGCRVCAASTVRTGSTVSTGSTESTESTGSTDFSGSDSRGDDASDAGNASSGCSRYMILVHGFRSSGERDFGLQFDFLRQCGFNVLVTDQRAHGRSDGEYISLGALEMQDVKSWTDFVLARDPAAEIILYGVSMGATACGGAAGLLKTVPALKGLILDCGYVSPVSELLHLTGDGRKPFIKTFMKIVSRNFLKKTGGDPATPDLLSAMKEISVPVLFVHGAKDTFVLPDNTEASFEACASPCKRLLIVEGAGHAGSFVRGEEEYRAAVIDLIKECFPKQPVNGNTEP